MSEEQDCQQLRAEISALTKSRERLRKLLDLLPQLIVECDMQGNVIYANQRVFDVTGYTRDDFENGLNATQFVVPEERQAVVENMQKVMRGEELHGNEYTAIRKDGSTFPSIVYSSYMVENGQSGGRIRAIIIDNTDRKREEIVKEALIDKLQKALDEIKYLQGIVPICMHCKKIRDDSGFWERVEEYLEKNVATRFSHGICPACKARFYPDL